MLRKLAAWGKHQGELSRHFLQCLMEEIKNRVTEEKCNSKASRLTKISSLAGRDLDEYSRSDRPNSLQ